MKKLKMDELGRPDLEEYKEIPKLPIVIMLDDIRSLNNVGSIFRSADSFRIERVVLCGITGKPPHREIHKTALGATESVEWTYEKDIQKAVEGYRADNYQILAAEQVDKSTPLDKFTLDKETKYVLVFGNEVFGVKDEIIQASDACLEIPQEGTKHSLNVAVSAGIVMWHFYTALRNKKGG